MDRSTNIRNVTVKSSSGKRASETSQLKGEAKDSLSGKNSTTEYSHSTAIPGPYGGMNKSK